VFWIFANLLSFVAHEKNRWIDISIADKLQHPMTKIYGQLDPQESTFGGLTLCKDQEQNLFLATC
jgi:hypothetical protein